MIFKVMAFHKSCCKSDLGSFFSIDASSQAALTPVEVFRHNMACWIRNDVDNVRWFDESRTALDQGGDIELMSHTSL